MPYDRPIASDGGNQVGCHGVQFLAATSGVEFTFAADVDNDTAALGLTSFYLRAPALFESKVLPVNQLAAISEPRGRQRTAFRGAGEIDGGKGLFQVGAAGLAVDTEPVPIVNTKGAVAGLLNFEEQAASTERVDRAGGD